VSEIPQWFVNVCVDENVNICIYWVTENEKHGIDGRAVKVNYSSVQLRL